MHGLIEKLRQKSRRPCPESPRRSRDKFNSAAIFDHLDSDFSAYFDWFTPGQNQKDPGIIILHVDDAVSSNSAGPASPHYKVIVEDAGYHPNHPWDGTDEFSDWWHPYEFRIGAAYAGEDSGQTAFTPWSVPNSDWYDGSSDVWITNISNSDSVMTFDLGFGNAWPAIVQAVPSPPETSLTEYDGFTFSVTVEDANLDPVTCLWFENGFLVQESADPTYWYRAGAAESVDTLLVVATDGDLADSLTWVIGAEPLITLAGLVEEGEFRLDWTEGPGASAYWIYGADNEPFFIPGFGPIYEHRLAVLPAGTTSWQSVAGVGDPATNLTYLVIVVDDTETELGRSNRIGEFDYGLAEPR